MAPRRVRRWRASREPLQRCVSGRRHGRLGSGEVHRRQGAVDPDAVAVRRRRRVPPGGQPRQDDVRPTAHRRGPVALAAQHRGLDVAGDRGRPLRGRDLLRPAPRLPRPAPRGAPRGRLLPPGRGGGPGREPDRRPSGPLHASVAAAQPVRHARAARARRAGGRRSRSTAARPRSSPVPSPPSSCIQKEKACDHPRRDPGRRRDGGSHRRSQQPADPGRHPRHRRRGAA